MALNVESAEHNLGIKVEGDLGDLQIIEEGSDSDEHSAGDCHEVQDERSGAGALSALPTGLQSPGAPVFGSVAVTNSENVQFGNNTYFHGPVTIKQIIQTNAGIDNAAYNKTEDENRPEKNIHSKEEPSVQKFKIQTWHKLVLSAVGVVIVSGICAVVIITRGSKTQDLPSTKNDDISNRDSSSKDDATTILIAPGHLRIVSRTDWLAQPVEKPLDVIRHPIPWVIITHTATAGCFNQSACVLSVRLIQTFHIESRGWYDIGYNFLVGGDGSAYYGRGWDYVGAHTKGYNKYSVGIAFIGTFNTDNPPRRQIEACQKLIRQGVEEGKLAKDYKLFAHRQLLSSLSPGDKVYDIIKEWPHFVKNDTDITELIPNY